VFRIMRMHGVFLVCKKEGLLIRQFQFFFLNLCSLGSNLRQIKYSLGSVTFVYMSKYVLLQLKRIHMHCYHAYWFMCNNPV